MLHHVVSTRITLNEYTAFCREITLTVREFVNSSNRGYKFCLALCSRMDSVYLGWYYRHKEFTLLGTGKSTPGNTLPF